MIRSLEPRRHGGVARLGGGICGGWDAKHILTPLPLLHACLHVCDCFIVSLAGFLSVSLLLLAQGLDPFVVLLLFLIGLKCSFLLCLRPVICWFVHVCRATNKVCQAKVSGQ